jgi:hypothetical protein
MSPSADDALLTPPWRTFREGGVHFFRPIL